MKTKLMLHVADDLELPPNIATLTTAVLGVRGSGKTNTAVVVTEELLKLNYQVVVIDPLDVWWGLKSSPDGESAGFPVTVFGGKRADVPLSEHMGRELADYVVDDGKPVILSLRWKGVSKSAQRRLVTDFAEQFYFRKGDQEQPTPVLVVIDEASLFIPQRFQADSARMVGAIESLVRHGRASGIGVMLIDQRAASVSKDVLTQIEMLVMHRSTSPQDRAALKAWIEEHDDADKGREFLSSLQKLPQGKAWFWSPSWLDLFRTSQVRKRETYDSSATPEMQQHLAPPRVFAEVDLDALRARMAASIERQLANDPKELKKRVEELTKQNAELVERIDELENSNEIERPPLLSDEDRKILLQSCDSIARTFDVCAKVKGLLEYRDADLDPQHMERVTIEQRSEGGAINRKVATSNQPASKISKPSTTQKSGRSLAPTAKPVTSGKPPSGGADRILAALYFASYHGEFLRRDDLAFLAGMVADSGTFGTYLSRHRTSGLITQNSLLLTVEGERVAKAMDWNVFSFDDVVDRWRKPLQGKAGVMFQAIVNAPNGISRDELLDAAEMADSGTFGTYLSRLRTSGLVMKADDRYIANPILFLDRRT